MYVLEHDWDVRMQWAVFVQFIFFFIGCTAQQCMVAPFHQPIILVGSQMTSEVTLVWRMVHAIKTIYFSQFVNPWVYFGGVKNSL